jgi:hypothetical protein|tara:strand:+ start:3187 stop:3690 length:504 start_codon:yes stop_codon:yes gene_type:complete
MAVEYWKANKEIQGKIQHLIGQHHPDLAIISDEVVAVFREKAGKAGGQVVLGNSKKVAALANALGGTEFKFVLELAADQWEHELTSKQQEALLDHLLTACRCEEDPKSGDFKLTVAKPDIMAFSENVERYGMWFPREADEEPTPVEQLFQEKPEKADVDLSDLLDEE